MKDEVTEDSLRADRKYIPVACGLFLIVILTIIFRHSDVVRGVASWVFGIALAIGGFIAGRVLRDFVRPDFVITTGGFSELLKVRVFWAIGPQVIGAFIGVIVANMMVQKLFPPASAPLSTLQEWRDFDGVKAEEFASDGDVHAQLVKRLAFQAARIQDFASILAKSSPEDEYELIRKNLKYGNTISVLDEGSRFSFVVHGCSTKNCSSKDGAFISFSSGFNSFDLNFLAISSNDGVISTGISGIPEELRPEYREWLTQVTGHDQMPDANDLTKPTPAPKTPVNLPPVAASVPVPQLEPRSPPEVESAPPTPPTSNAEAHSAPPALVEAPGLPASTVDAPIAQSAGGTSAVTSLPLIPTIPQGAPEPVAIQEAAMTPRPEPSFSCAKAASQVEKLICSDVKLASEDLEMATAYKAAFEKSTYQFQVRTQQISWITNVRNKCQNVSCLLAAYEMRMNQLKI